MAAFQNMPQAWRRLIFLIPVLIITLILASGLYTGSLPKPRMPKVVFDDSHGPFHSDCQANHTPPNLDSLPDIIRALWQPLILPITAPRFVTLDGTEKLLPPQNELVHTKPMGKRICILDVDTRDLAGEGSIFYSEGVPPWDKLGSPSAGFLSHYLYAQIHGYSYKFIRAPQYADRAPHWSKVIFTKELLKEYDIVVMMDYDAMFPSPEVPLEWMLNYWKIDRDVIVAMAEDPAGEPNFDDSEKHKVNINSGFIIAQAGEKSQRLFKDWAECPSEVRYKGCAKWAQTLFHEQAAFSTHVRYDFLDGYSIETHPQYIRMLPCQEANGIPEVSGSGCVGHLVRHYWGRKGLTNREFGHNVMAALTPLLVQAAYKEPGHVEDLRSKVLKGAEVLDKPPAR
ncbi:hypothetical protein QC763_404310 [Podospora pseudopauciseta]|nr:hypothetical protein QC761_404310 [Podospora bellae-mahoneyi]KAK4666391.1 hypothetical protein QC763_404310 [Podospora pseudopauciseta]KAK4677559.1 hypothetical protein QC764_404310 [Podospora pseudoanserina]